MTRFYLIGNNGYSVQDTPEPEEWVKPLLACRLKYLEFFTDHMEPVIMENVIRNRSEYFMATQRVLELHGIKTIIATSARISYLLNVLSHPYDDARQEGIRWCKRMVDLAVALGARFVNGHFDYISKKDARERPALAERRMLEGMLLLANYAAEKGIEGIGFEQMHGPQLLPYTMEQTERFFRWLNERSPIPFYLLADTGHMAHVNPKDPNHTAADKDPCAWLCRKYAGMSKIFVHLQQSDRKASRHWPFTPRYNRRGIVKLDKVIESIEASGVEEAYCSLEILYPRGVEIEDVTRDYECSGAAFRRTMARRGYVEKECVFEHAGETQKERKLP